MGKIRVVVFGMTQQLSTLMGPDTNTVKHMFLARVFPKGPCVHAAEIWSIN